MLHVQTIAATDFECAAIRRGHDVIVVVAEQLLTARAARAINAVVRELERAED